MHHDVPAVVLKLVADPWQHGGLGIARSLGRLGVPVYVAIRESDTPASRSRYVAGRFVMPAPEEPAALIVDRLLSMAAEIGPRPVLIPTDDVAALFVDAHAGELAEAYRFPVRPPGLALRLSDKRELHRLCEEVGVPTPLARFPATRAELLEAARELGLPVVLKSMDPTLLRRRPNAASVAMAADLDEAGALYDRMEDPDEPNLMVQQFIPGGSESVWMFNGYLDRDGECRLGVVGRKIRQAPPSTGATTLGEVVRNDAVVELAVRFLQAVGYRGIVDMGFRFDARDGTYRLLDVNPRIGSSFRLFVASNGLDVARALYRDLTDQPVPEARAVEGRRWWVENQDLGTIWRMFRSGDLSPWRVPGSLRGVREAAWFAGDDLRPAATLAGAMLAAAVRRVRPGR